MSFRAEVVEKLKSNRSKKAADLLELIESGPFHAIAQAPADTTVHEALRLWRTRLRNTALTRQEITGLPELVQSLERVTPQKRLEQFGFSMRDTALTVFLEKKSGDLVGAISVKR